MTEIPEETFQLKYLKKLCLGFNNIDSCDDLPLQLEVLSLNNNKILEISPEIKDLSFLVTLDLSYNIIKNVTNLAHLSSLRVLFLRYNKVILIFDDGLG